MFGGCVCGGNQIFRFVAHTGQGRRLHRDRLGRKGHLARDIAFRYRTLFDAENRLAGFAVQDIHVSGFRCHGQSRNRPPATNDVEQSGRRRRVGVPQIVMDSLEVPLVRAGLDIDGDH